MGDIRGGDVDMKKLCVIGEALIDFIPEAKGLRLKDVTSFKKVAGGAPANVAAAVSRLGGRSKIVTQLGQDAFGDYLVETMQACGIEIDDVYRTTKGDTALAFVSLAEDGNRDFKFYRRTSADLMLEESRVTKATLQDCGVLHFCSVDLVESPMKATHRKLIDLAKQQEVVISFDPNLRLSLWDDEQALKDTVNEFIPYAHILKIADEELEFITGKQSMEEALPQLFVGNVQYVIYTLGKDGARIYRRDASYLHVDGLRVHVMDTTGAGDSFIGAFLYCMLAGGVEHYSSLSDTELLRYLTFANDYAAHTTSKEGAIPAMASQEEIAAFILAMQEENTAS